MSDYQPGQLKRVLSLPLVVLYGLGITIGQASPFILVSSSFDQSSASNLAGIFRFHWV